MGNFLEKIEILEFSALFESNVLCTFFCPKFFRDCESLHILWCAKNFCISQLLKNQQILKILSNSKSFAEIDVFLSLNLKRTIKNERPEMLKNLKNVITSITEISVSSNFIDFRENFFQLWPHVLVIEVYQSYFQVCFNI